ncbi:hypothetical protein TNCV_222941 [Trichonephila clavipes]|nr:hypothetical protein TNCV_222941 [Trichonephila clavipes]
MLTAGVVLLHENARPHTARRTADVFTDFGWELLDHPPYSPDLATAIFTFSCISRNYCPQPLQVTYMEFTRNDRNESKDESSLVHSSASLAIGHSFRGRNHRDADVAVVFGAPPPVTKDDRALPSAMVGVQHQDENQLDELDAAHG